jgi:hypothetical protein
LNSPLELWWNRTPLEQGQRHWLQLRLTGKRSNRSAIGAQVHLKTDEREQMRTVTNSVGYASSSDLTVHFGLAEATRGVVEIQGPSGQLQKLGEVEADRRLQVAEPDAAS